MNTPPVSVRDLKVHFPIREGVWNRIIDHMRTVDGVSFDLHRGRTVAIVGEPGSGKSTTGHAEMGMEAPTGGQVLIDGRDRAAMTATERRATTCRLQIIFQDPTSALNPRMKVADCIAEPLQIHHIGTAADRAGCVWALAGPAGLGAGPAAARVLGRAEAAHRHRPRAGAGTGGRGLRRTGLGTGCLDPVAGSSTCC